MFLPPFTRSFVRSACSLALALGLTAAVLPAQHHQIIGSLAGRTSGAALAKGNCLRADRTVILQDYCFYLELLEPQTLVFTIHRAIAERANYVLEQSWTIPAQPLGAQWYSPGSLAIPLIAGNHYILSVSWSGSTIYSFHPEASWPLVFGEQRYAYWSGMHPLTTSIAGRNEMPATYLMSLTTREVVDQDPNVRVGGTGCSNSGFEVPHFSCNQMPLLGNQNFVLEVAVDAPGRPAWIGITPYSAVPPITLSPGCELYLDPTGTWISVGPVLSNSEGLVRVPIGIPYDPTISGIELPLQSAVLNSPMNTLDLSNALYLRYR